MANEALKIGKIRDYTPPVVIRNARIIQRIWHKLLP
jgi:hypothetical protein